ncbi:uncharacterized protein LOC135928222 [Gordionus sp. m RMFG-2023]|uniref:uncharacterized protein LOC135928222 n=1 Tax=Gordionus sp. m RMFG-2023 TaxID=3053472 RepID=UPI0031FCA313
MCDKKMKSIPSNLKRHITSQHPNIMKADESNSDSSFNARNTAKEKFPKIKIDKSKVFECIVWLITVHNLPINLVNYEGFRILLDPICHSLQMKINTRSVVDKIKYTASEIRLQIIHELKNKLISLKIDTATRYNKSILGINVQYIKDGQIQVRTLGMIELIKIHTGINLKEEIQTILKKYQIDLKQIYSITVDNGANMLKMVDTMARDQLNNDNDLSNSNENNLSQILFNTSVSYQENVCIDDENVSVYSDEETPEGIDEENISDDISKSFGLSCIRCSAHTIQLAVNMFIKKYLKLDLEKIRIIIKLIKSHKYKRLFIMDKVSKPTLDIITRWNSTYLMMKNLMDNKTFYTKMGELYPETFISFDLWDIILLGTSVLFPLYKFTMKLQKSNIVIGDFFASWLECKMELEEMDNNLSKSMLECLNIRESYLFQNDAFRSAIYMDPRFHYENGKYPLEEDKILAREHIFATWKQLQAIDPHEENTTLVMPSTSDYKKTKLDLYIERDCKKGPIFYELCNSDIKLKIKSLLYNKRLPSSQDILQYWVSRKHQDAELFKLSQIILAAPCTQVSVERAFSALALTVTSLRTRLDKDILDDILIIKLNSTLLNNVIF